MKVIAIGSVDKPVTPEQRAQIMPKEVPATLKLYLDGKIEQPFFRADKLGVVFFMNVDSVEHAKKELDTLPLVQASFMTFELIPVGPLAPLGMLIK